MTEEPKRSKTGESENNSVGIFTTELFQQNIA